MTSVSRIYNERLDAVMSQLDGLRSQVVNPSELFRDILREKLGAVTADYALQDDTAQASAQSLTSDISGLLSGLSGMGLDGSGYMSVLNALALRQMSDVLTAQTALLSASSETTTAAEVPPAEETAAVQAAAPAEAPPGLPALDLPVTAYDDLINAASEKYALPAYLIKGVIQTESSFRSGAVSSAGAEGLMQLMPGTARMLGVTDSFDPAQNIDGGSKYLRQLIDRYGGDVRMALAAYNCGPGRVSEMTAGATEDEAYQRIASSVRGYVDNVIGHARSFAI